LVLLKRLSLTLAVSVTLVPAATPGAAEPALSETVTVSGPAGVR
jgi:hypothetical protein